MDSMRGRGGARAEFAAFGAGEVAADDVAAGEVAADDVAAAEFAAAEFVAEDAVDMTLVFLAP
jgi:hypothetical protein